MERPFVTMHMLVSIDGKITGDYMKTELAAELCEEYYRINREYEADAFACGRITMEGSFTFGAEPKTHKGEKLVKHDDFVAKQSDYYAVAIDPHGRLGWSASEISDYDPGYDKAHIIEVLTDEVSSEYLEFLQKTGISYIFCGSTEIDCALMLKKLYSLFGIKTLMLEGGGKTDALFFNADCIDELSLIVVPIVDSDENGIDLFVSKNGKITSYDLKTVQPLPQGGLWLNYVKKQN